MPLFFTSNLGYHEIRLSSGLVIKRSFVLFRFGTMTDIDVVREIIHEHDFDQATSKYLIVLRKVILNHVACSETRSGFVATFGDIPLHNRISLLGIPKAGRKPEEFSIPAFPRQTGWTVLAVR